MKSVSVIGMPMWLGQTRYGTNLGPEALRRAGMMNRLQALNPDIIDLGDLTLSQTTGQGTPSLKNLKQVAAANVKLSEKVAAVIAEGRFPLVLGGDHSIAVGSIAGAAKHYSRMGVIWFDAHADINTPETTPSGNIHGMPLAVSLGLGHPALTRIGGYQPKIQPEQVVFIGVRDIDPGEQDLIREKQIKVFTAEDVARRGIEQVIEETLAYLSRQCDGIHLSFDMDGIDPCQAPGVGTPVDNGVSLEDSRKAIRLLAASNRITSCDIVEVNPLFDKEQTTVLVAVELIALLFGEAGADISPGDKTVWCNRMDDVSGK
ncbi:arginase [Acetonema longum]|uniref:Arginase n=1 Tax=Acetonema longum DSM 6540 TaxID=1009370 RepID=F7NKJ1_9FIRM|nr:arginase [Acetonema longum]EGO63443.1 arginase [Acetonema longum DSM 6540]